MAPGFGQGRSVRGVRRATAALSNCRPTYLPSVYAASVLKTDINTIARHAIAMASPASPRLPSPPPIPEDQVSPVSASPEQQKLFSNLDHAAERRIRPGTKAADMAEGPPLVDLSEVRLRTLSALGVRV